MAKSNRWTQDSIRTARANLSARLHTVMRLSETQLREEFRQALGADPSTTVSFEALRRWLVDCAIDQHLPDSPPTPRSEKPVEPTNAERRNIGL